MVERVTGCPREVFLKVADALARNSGRERTGAICYAVGWTHHTTGVQMIRAAAILQALLGNVGRPGGGILALRGHCSIQGSTDIPTLYNMLPTYLPQPNAFKPHKNLKDYLEHERTPTGWWHNFPKYAVSLLKAWYGERATKANEWGFEWLPRIVGDHSQLPMTLAVRDGVIRGLFVIGQNPAVGGHNANMVQRGLAELEWLVVRDTVESETASFWYKGNPVRAGDLAPKDIKTEVFLMPGALAAEKAGSFTNTHRLVQWHDKVVEPPGDARSESWFAFQLGRRLKRLYATSADPKDAPIQALTWDYPVADDKGEPDTEAVLKEMNGYTVADRKQVASYKELKDDGSTACGAWLYCGVFPKQGDNRARSRVPDAPEGPGTHLDWAWAWPSNRRNMYNRASADKDGEPWSEGKRLIAWNSAEHKWAGDDVPDFEEDKPPDYQPPWRRHPAGMAAHDGNSPAMMIADGKFSLFTPSGLKDAPLPAHYEPLESPIRNPFYAQQSNPVAKIWERADNRLHTAADPRFPYTLTTYRVTEHHSGGLPTRTTPVLAELQPENYAEISPELAAELGIANLDWVTLSTARGEIAVKALVTERLRPLRLDGSVVHQVGVLWHFGWEGYAPGEIANVLTSVVGDPNTSMHEAKALTCNLRWGRPG
jgi:formate dehydrogenase major subunit